MVRLRFLPLACRRTAATCLLVLSGSVCLSFSAPATAAASFSLSPVALEYGDQTLFTKRTQSAWLKNTGTVSLELNSIDVVGADSTHFTRTHSCGAALAVATTCRVYVTFLPTSVGAKSASLRVVAGGNIIRTSSLSGTGVIAQFSLTPTSLWFGSVPINTTSTAQKVTVENTGSGKLPIQSIKLGGTNPGQFSRTHDCPYSVAVGGSCSVQVAFKPSSTGSKSAALVVTPAGGGSPKSVALGGQGSSAGLPTATSSSQSGYVVPTAAGWSVVPLLTVGDKPSGSSYAMVGKADGLGAIAGKVSSTGQILEAGRYLTVFMNHELPVWAGAVRAHGTTGAFVSQWTFDINSLRVVEGRDLVARTFAFTGGAWTNVTGSLVFDRLCSADLPSVSAFFNPQTGNGFQGRLFMNGEEAGTEGRAFAHVATGAAYGNSYVLPSLGKFAYENVVAHPASGDTTLTVGLDDATPGQVYVYVGTKKNLGNPVVRAGLHGGRLYGVKVVDGGVNYGGGAVPRENKGAINGRFELVDVSQYALGSGATLNSASAALGITDFARPEDGHWDNVNARSFYWATTGASIDGVWQTARLYKLTFDSIAQPTGGTIELVVDSRNLTGSDGARARGFDNITVDGDGRVLVQEDGGDSEYITKTWRVDPATRSAVQILESDRNRFTPGAPGFLTAKEENSGVIEITSLVRNASWYQAGRRYYLGTNQAHHFLDATLYTGGQLYLFASPP